MKVYTLIGFLLLGIVAGVARAQLGGNINIEEIKHITGDVFVFDDEGKPVKVDFNQDDSEDMETTQGDLPNRIFFYLYTRRTLMLPEKLIVGDPISLTNSRYDPKKPTKIVTHGWINSHISPACTLVRDAFLLHGDYNVIVVDWSKISHKPYLWASNRVVMVAKYVSGMIDFLASYGMQPSDLTVVGHSLGAHVALLSSHHAKNKAFFAVGLDPAGPNFHLKGEGERASKNDAKYVEIIHSSMALGLTTPIGDADFFPNGGMLQNCMVDPGQACSHVRSYKYFAESINSNAFLARKCDSYENYIHGRCNSNPLARMGGISPQLNVTGHYYLSTNSAPPYAKNEAFGHLPAPGLFKRLPCPPMCHDEPSLLG